MKVILYNINNNARLKLYEQLFEKIDFNIIGLIYEDAIPEQGKYKLIKREQLKSLEFDYILAHNLQMRNLRKMMDEEGIPQNKAITLYYDFNNVQKVIGTNNIKYLFYDGYKIEDNKLEHFLKTKSLSGKYTGIKSNISEEQKDKIIHELYLSYKKQIEGEKNIAKVYRSGANWGNFMKRTRPEYYEAVRETLIN